MHDQAARGLKIAEAKVTRYEVGIDDRIQGGAARITHMLRGTRDLYGWQKTKKFMKLC